MEREAVRLDVELGMGSGGTPVTLDLAKAPHLLIAGMTGSGKSVVVNSIVTQLIDTFHDDEVAFIFIDPKRVELAPYKDLPHAYAPPVYALESAIEMLDWAVGEMSHRYTLMERYGHVDIDARNARNDARIPHMVIVIDELANLMLADRARVEPLLVKLASMGRAAGIHLVLATQRPSSDVITGLIKANVPARVCLAVTSAMESRIVLDSNGAEDLNGPGEMLVRIPGSRELVYAKGAYISREQVQESVKRAVA